MRVDRLISTVSIIYIITIFAFAAGIIHAIIESGGARQQLFMIPRADTQTSTEAVLGVLIFLLGTAGFYLIHKASAPQAVKTQKVLFISGFSILAISLLSLYLIMNFKGSV